MASMPDPITRVTAGVDTHRDFHVVAVFDQLGRLLATDSFPATNVGYQRLLDWLEGFGPVHRVGVEGTGAWGAGLCRYLTGRGLEVVEVIRPNRQHRRRNGKSDTADAIAAGRAVLSGEADGSPRGGTGPVESLRLLKVARRSAMKQRTAVANQIHAVTATAPDQLRAELRDQSLAVIIDQTSRYRPTGLTDPYQAAKHALRSLARRYLYLTGELDDLDTQIKELTLITAPTELMQLIGVGPQTGSDLLVAAGSNPHRLKDEASFAALCGASPVDASSGRQEHHRLNRGGDRQANAALYRIVIVRLRYHQPTRDYMTRRLKEGLTRKQIIRCLKRYAAREIATILNKHQPQQQAT